MPGLLQYLQNESKKNIGLSLNITSFQTSTNLLDDHVGLLIL